MTRNLMMTATVAALLSGSALAQTAPSTPSPGMPSTPGGTSAPAAPSTTTIPQTPSTMPNRSTVLSGSDMLADKIQGLYVYTMKQDSKVASPSMSTSGNTLVAKDEYRKMREGYQSIGKIDDLVIGMDGRVQGVVISVGGFLGVGDKNVALSWNDLRFVRSSEGDALVYVEKAKNDLEQMPAFKAAMP